METFALLIDHFQPIVEVIDSTFYGISQEALIVLAISTLILAGGSIFLMIISLLFLRAHHSVISSTLEKCRSQKKSIKFLEFERDTLATELEGATNELRVLKKFRLETEKRQRGGDGAVGRDLPISGDV